MSDEPSVVAVTPSRSPRDLSTLRAGKGDEKPETTGERFFTYEDLYDAYAALDAARWAMQIHHLRSKGALTLGAEIVETIRERWQSHKDAPIMRAMAEAQHLAEHPHVCKCKRRFRTRARVGDAHRPHHARHPWVGRVVTDCELCGDAVVDAASHPCCAWWKSQREWESQGCVACNESRKARRGRKWKR